MAYSKSFFYATNELVLDAKGMLIHEVALDKNGSKSFKFDYKNDVLKITLDKTYQKIRITLFISNTLPVPMK
jgi:hypothetical protein